MIDINEVKGTKKVEIPYLEKHLEDTSKSVLIVGERKGEPDKISKTVKECGFNNVITTDIIEKEEGSWLDTETDWEHITIDFVEFNDEMKFDYIVAISIFEHFGFWYANKEQINDTHTYDIVKWNEDLRAFATACSLLKDKQSKLIVTLPAGPYMNYRPTGEPFLRYYDKQRQNIIHDLVKQVECEIVDEHYFHSSDFEVWEEMDKTIMEHQHYHAISPYTPNLIWAFTIMKK